MKNPKQVCMDYGIYARIGIRAAEVMAKVICEDVQKILTTPSQKTVHEQLCEYFDIK